MKIKLEVKYTWPLGAMVVLPPFALTYDTLTPAWFERPPAADSDSVA
jgi:hypothetical protein